VHLPRPEYGSTDDRSLKHLPLTLGSAFIRGCGVLRPFHLFFPPVELNRKELDLAAADFPHERDYLTDGGIYDNLGIRKTRTAFTDRSNPAVQTLVISDASAAFDWDVGFRIFLPSFRALCARLTF
jgi:hypothetical protein